MLGWVEQTNHALANLEFRKMDPTAISYFKIMKFFQKNHEYKKTRFMEFHPTFKIKLWHTMS